MTVHDEPSSAPERTRTERIFSIITVFLLSATAVLTAWCGFQSSKWGGEMSIAFSEASSSRIQAEAAEGEARDARLYDLSIYSQWVVAESDRREGLTEFIEERFTPQFRTAFEAWNAGDRQELGPLSMEEYVPPGAVEADQLRTRADTKFDEALTNNQRGDNYSLLTVLFALVLFFTAMSQRALGMWSQRILLGLAIIVGFGCLLVMLTFPIKI